MDQPACGLAFIAEYTDGFFVDSANAEESVCFVRLQIAFFFSPQGCALGDSDQAKQDDWFNPERLVLKPAIEDHGTD